MKEVMAWVIGPHLIGLLFMLIGLVQKNFPPKKINNYYGYRMPSAMKNQQTWDEANCYSAIMALKIGAWMFVIGLMLTVLAHIITFPANAKFLFTYLVLLVSSMGSVLILITATENHLDRTFKDK
jgi:uncharacterized membrane protein